MENLSKVISLHQASIISGYHQDYLSFLIRKREIKGEKMGRNWVTTEEEIRNYILNKEIKHKKSILKYFLYFKKINKGLISGFICFVIFSVGIYVYNDQTSVRDETQVLNKQFSNFPKPEIKEVARELKF